jgi:glycosyltransferase involved in cell wall biosynthesis
VLADITPLILTFNEEPNIARTLSKLAWAKDIVVVDSCSTDRTAAIVQEHRNARLFERRFTTHTEQWNFGLHDTGIATEWVLALDADYVLSDELIAEIARLVPDAGINGYQASFVFCISGEPIRSGVYPDNIVLFRRSEGMYWQDGHTQRVRVTPAIARLQHRILHDDRKSLAHWLSAQYRYMRLEAGKLRATSFGDLSFGDKLRRLIVVAPVVVTVYCLLVRGGLLDGRRGVMYAMQRATAEAILGLCLLESPSAD